MNTTTTPVNIETATLIDEFKEASAAGRFLLRWCPDCDRPHWYPRPICPFCIDNETEWRESEGQGVIYSYSVAPKSDNGRVIAYVTLSEGITMLTNIVTNEPDSLAIGQAVEVVRDLTLSGLPLFQLSNTVAKP